MVILLIVLLIIILGLVFSNFFMRREINRLNERIKELDLESNQLLEINLFNRSINRLTETLNRQFMGQRAYRIAAINREHELKETISNISHDLRTPLTAIIGYLQLLERENLSLEQEEAIQILLKKSQAMKNLTQAFFELSYYESQVIETKPEKINLSNLLIEEMLKETVNFESKEIEPIFDIQEECFIFSDVKLVTRILQNIITNALQHGREELTVRLVKKEKVILTFSNKYDPKLEIDPGKIFQRFYVANEAREKQGSGLGLAIVELLCQRIDSSVSASVDSNYFTIQLEISSYE